MKAILFIDINGTLIERDSRTDLAFCKAVDQLLGTKDIMERVDNTARSDLDVFHEVLSLLGRSFEQELWDELISLYEAELQKAVGSGIWRPNVDAISFVKKCHEAGYPLYLITGELSLGAKYKLKEIGLWDYFSGGGFGEDARVRIEIGRAALRKAKKAYPDHDHYVVIGDTPLDIEVARDLQATAISIATGSSSQETLQEYEPDEVITAFSQIKSIKI